MPKVRSLCAGLDCSPVTFLWALRLLMHVHSPAVRSLYPSQNSSHNLAGIPKGKAPKGGQYFLIINMINSYSSERLYCNKHVEDFSRNSVSSKAIGKADCLNCQSP